MSKFYFTNNISSILNVSFEVNSFIHGFLFQSVTCKSATMSLNNRFKEIKWAIKKL